MTAHTCPPTDIIALVQSTRRALGAPGLASVFVPPGARTAQTVLDGVTMKGGAAITPRCLFGIGSLTKALTALACRLSDPTLDTLRLPDGLEAHGLTAGDALSGATSLAHRDEIVLRLMHQTRPDYLRAALRLPRRTPGFVYSNAMFTLAAEALAAERGGSWFDTVKDLVLDPLAMQDTVEATGAAPAGPAAMPHLPDSAGPPNPQGWGLFGREVEGGAGAILSSAQDMGRWLRWLCGADDGLPRDALPDLFAPRMSVGDDPLRHLADRGGASLHSHYGLGWFISEIGNRHIAHHSGGFGGYSSYVALDLETSAGVVLMANTRSGRPILQAGSLAVLDILAARDGPDWIRLASTLPDAPSFFALLDPPAPAAPNAPLGAYCGRYETPVLGPILTIAEARGELTLIAGRMRAQLVPVGGHAMKLTASGILERAFEDVLTLPPPDAPQARGMARRAAALDKIRRVRD